MVRVLGLVSLVLCAAPASAQTKLYVLFAGDGVFCRPTDCEPPRVLEIDVDGRRVLANTPVQHARENTTIPVVTADGQYLAWIGTENRSTASSYLSVFDTSTRGQIPLVRTSVRGDAGSLFADATAVRLFSQFQYGSPLTVLEPQSSRGMAVPCTGAQLAALSGDGTRLFVRCGTTAVPPVVVLDSITGTTVATMPEAGFYSAVDDAGAIYFTASLPPSGLGTVLSRYDVASGQLVAQRVIADASPAGPMAVDPRTGRVYLGVGSTPPGIRVYEGDTLGDVTHLPAPVMPARPSLVIDPDRPAAYVVWNAPVGTGGWRSVIAIYDTVGFTIVAQAELGNDSLVNGMVLGPRPPRTDNLVAAVAGRVVTLKWTNQAARSIPTGLVVEAGSSPGRSDLARLPVTAGQDALTVPDVPPGTYYVRVRSVNGTGLGDASNEISIVIR
jgi:hypothetical protein